MATRLACVAVRRLTSSAASPLVRVESELRLGPSAPSLHDRKVAQQDLAANMMGSTVAQTQACLKWLLVLRMQLLQPWCRCCQGFG